MAGGDSGIDLAERFFHTVVEPIIERTAPGLDYAAALIGPGSKVLGYDTVMSRDHDWSPRVLIFVSDYDEAIIGASLRMHLDCELPDPFDGFPVRIEPSGAGAGEAAIHEKLAHRVVVSTVRSWSAVHLGWPDLSAPTVSDWLARPQQRLLEFTAGRVFRDDSGELTEARRRLGWYPDDVWRYLLACQWQSVAQLEPFVGRTGDVGDNIGSSLIAATLVRDAIRLAFLVERRYAPYAKWLGTAFRELPIAAGITQKLESALTAVGWERCEALVSVFETLGRATNALGLSAPTDATARQFYERPYLVLDGHRFRQALDERISDPEVRAIIDRVGWVGAVDQFSDSVDLLTSPNRRDLFDQHVRERPRSQPTD